MEKYSLRCDYWNWNFSYFLLSLNLEKLSFFGPNFQDCAGVILCAAERATQVALQVRTKKLLI